MLHTVVGFGSLRSPTDLADALGRVGFLQVSAVGAGRSEGIAGAVSAWPSASVGLTDSLVVTKQ